MIEEGNFIGNADPDVGGETEFLHCNFAQRVPVDNGNMEGVRLFPSVSDGSAYVFTECNLVNCEPPPGAKINNCLTIIKSFKLPGTPDTLTIDGQTITITGRLNRVYGKYTEAGYVYFPPRDTVVD